MPSHTRPTTIADPSVPAEERGTLQLAWYTATSFSFSFFGVVVFFFSSPSFASTFHVEEPFHEEGAEKDVREVGVGWERGGRAMGSCVGSMVDGTPSALLLDAVEAEMEREETGDDVAAAAAVVVGIALAVGTLRMGGGWVGGYWGGRSRETEGGTSVAVVGTATAQEGGEGRYNGYEDFVSEDRYFSPAPLFAATTVAVGRGTIGGGGSPAIQCEDRPSVVAGGTLVAMVVVVVMVVVMTGGVEAEAEVEGRGAVATAVVVEVAAGVGVDESSCPLRGYEGGRNDAGGIRFSAEEEEGGGGERSGLLSGVVVVTGRVPSLGFPTPDSGRKGGEGSRDRSGPEDNHEARNG